MRQVARDPDSHLIPGVGVRFTDIDPRDERRIDHYVRSTVLESGTDPDEDRDDADRS